MRKVSGTVIYNNKGLPRMHLIKGSAFISYCCCDKLWQTQKLKKHKFIIIQWWSVDVRCLSHWATFKMSPGLPFFLEGLQENLFPCLIQRLETEAFLDSLSSSSSWKPVIFFLPFIIVLKSNFPLPALSCPQFPLWLHWAHLNSTG